MYLFYLIVVPKGMAGPEVVALVTAYTVLGIIEMMVVRRVLCV